MNASKLQSRRGEKCARELATEAMVPCRVRRAEWELLSKLARSWRMCSRSGEERMSTKGARRSEGKIEGIGTAYPVNPVCTRGYRASLDDWVYPHVASLFFRSTSSSVSFAMDHAGVYRREKSHWGHMVGSALGQGVCKLAEYRFWLRRSSSAQVA